ncbi:hypothetical protein JYU04_03255 [Dehalococcoides mccartyi]|nr:hypothetical protein [Dehalococcoides mccartyi]
MPSDSEKEQSQKPVDAEEQRFRTYMDEIPKPGEEIQLNLKKFALVLGVILVFALIAGAITNFGG